MAASATTAKKLFWGVNALLGVAFIVELCAPLVSGALDAVTILLAAIASIMALNQQLPLQNVLPAVLIAAIVGSLAHALSALPSFGIPFGPVVFNPAAGGKIFHVLPWPIPLLWVVAIFNARGMARLILRPWRKVRNYGYWLIGLTAALAVAFDVALEPYAWHVKHLWLWQKTKIALTWHGTTLLNFVGWAFVAAIIMIVATPFMIRKQPGNPNAPDYHPLALWLGAFLLFVVGSAGVGLWWALGVDVVLATVTTVFAVRGAKW